LSRLLALAALLSILATAPAALAVDDAPYPATVSFLATRNGEPIGTHTLNFADDNGRRTVTVAIDLGVKVAGVTIYRYVHRGRETWQAGLLQSLVTTTDDNGAQHEVKGARAGDRFKVDRSLKPAGLLPGSTEQNPASVQYGSETLPGDVLPTSHWNVRQARQTQLLNTQLGQKIDVQVTDMGRETVRTRARSLQATRYRYAGDLKLDQWFDEKGLWVKLSFLARDGSTIEYTLQD
jgi:hypothetical protein